MQPPSESRASAPSETALSECLFEVSQDVRYVALLQGGELLLLQRPGLDGASGAETDRYEELLVNPTVLELCRRRGELDCGGLNYVLIRYGKFFQFLTPLLDGHVSVAIEPQAKVRKVVREMRSVLADWVG